MKKLFFLLVALPLLLVASLRATPRCNYTINSGWYFHHGDTAPDDNSFGGDGWQKVNLPHTWNNLDAFDETPGYWRGTCWYAYTLRPAQEWKGKQIYLQFEGANQVADLFIDGVHIGSHTGGYTAFNFNITKYIDFQKPNIVKVKLDNSHNKNIPPLNADFNFYGGIYRNVRIIVVDPVHFDLGNCASDGVFVETPSVSAQSATVVVRGGVVNAGLPDRNLVVNVVISDAAGRKVASGSEKLNMVAAGSTAGFSLAVTVPSPNLWSPETPYLYNTTVSVSDTKSGAELDNITIPTGMRWFGFDGNGFMLNGKRYALRGANRHQDFQGMGNALPDDFHRNDYTMIKSLGFNFVRLAHYPQAQEVYRTCDRLGLLVWSEIPVVNEITPTEEFTDNCLNMQREQIRQTYNHPCVILYGYMNEILLPMLTSKKLNEEQRQKIASDTRELALKLNTLTKQEAPYRNTVMAIHYDDGYNKYGVATIPDVIGYNLYFGWYYESLEDLTRFLTQEHKNYPARPIIISEFGADADIRNHSQVPRSWDFSEEYQIQLHHSYLKQFAALPFLAGYALWNFADFGAENRADAIPWINKKGIFTFDRREKDVASLYKAHLLKSPIVYIASRNYAKRAGLETSPGVCRNSIDVFSNGNTIELKLNGVSLGKKTADTDMASFDVPFRQGTNRLEATDERGIKDRLDIEFDVVPANLKQWQGRDLAVNVGSYQNFVNPQTGVIWIADRVYAPGGWGRIGGEINERTDRYQHKVGISQNILGTNCNPLYQTFVEGIEKYRFDVNDGKYAITLCFVESNPKTPAGDQIYDLSDAQTGKAPAGVRRFGFSVNGMQIMDNLNLARDYGNLRAVEFTVVTQARNGGGVEVDFTPVAGKTTLSGIRIIKME